MEYRAEIRRLHRGEVTSMKVMARREAISKHIVKRALVWIEPQRYERRSQGSVIDELESRSRALLSWLPEIPAPVIAERVVGLGR